MIYQTCSSLQFGAHPHANKGDSTMTIIVRNQEKELTRNTKDAIDVWRRERRAELARQLAANAEIKQRWMQSNPIEISQRQSGYHANARMPAYPVAGTP